MAVSTNQPLAADPTPPRLIPELPDDLSLRCIARVPRSSHPDLALVSPSWRSLLRSPLLFKLRSDLGVTEPSLCIHIRHSGEQPPRWYLLIRGHHRRPGRLLPLPPTPIPTSFSASAVLGHSLFVLGGSNSGISTSAVQIFNPHTNSWLLGPQMGTARNNAATASTLGGRIYVVGGCPRESDSWTEVFDPTSGVWAHVPSPPLLREKWMNGSAVLSGRLLAVGHKAGVVFDPAAAESWTAVSESLYKGWGSWGSRVSESLYKSLYKGRGSREAVVNGVLYSYDNNWKLNGYDPVSDDWKPVEGIEGELSNHLFDAIHSKLANLGELLCVVWFGSWRSCEEREINCVGIEITRTSAGGLWGSVAWRESAPVAIPAGSSSGPSLGPCMTLEF